MPTIEIASINSTGLDLNQSDYNVAIIVENKLESHRGLFYDLLLKENGAIIHIGNPDFKNNKEGGFFAGQIIDWDFEPTDIYIPEYDSDDIIDSRGENQQFRFRFLDPSKPDIDRLLQVALNKSPIKKVCFLTDYQFGPEKGSIELIYTIKDFWTRHDNEGLNFNTMYELYGQ